MSVAYSIALTYLRDGNIRSTCLGTNCPEAYNEGYRQWRELRAQGNAAICETSVLDCAHLSR
jgi:hypothetical protein